MQSRVDASIHELPGLRSRRPATLASLAAVVVLAMGLGARDARAADSGIPEEARARFSAGVNLLMDPEGPRYEEAYREFTAAYAASGSYKILGNLGLCAMKLERDDEAISAYEKYLAEAKELSPAEAQQIRTDLATLKTGVAHATLESDPPGAKVVDIRVTTRGEKVINAYGPLDKAQRVGLRQGSHQITAKLEGFSDQAWEVDAAGGQDLPAHKFVFTKPVEQPLGQGGVPAEPPPAPLRPVPAGVWVGVAATGALAVATGVMGVISLKHLNDYNSINNGTEPSTATSQRKSGETLDLITDICLGGAVVAAGVTAIVYFTRPTVRAHASTGLASRPAPVVLAPALGRTSAGVSLQGTF